MKKVILFLIVIFSMAVSAKALTESEKNEMLRQFSVFQEALRTKDGNTLKGMIKFPIVLVEHGRDYEELTKAEYFSDEVDEVTEEFKGLTYMKVNMKNNSVSDYLEKGFACDMKYTGEFKGNELHITGLFVPGESDSCGGYITYKFKIYKNKLKLFDIERKW